MLLSKDEKKTCDELRAQLAIIDFFYKSANMENFKKETLAVKSGL